MDRGSRGMDMGSRGMGSDGGDSIDTMGNMGSGGMDMGSHSTGSHSMGSHNMGSHSMGSRGMGSHNMGSHSMERPSMGSRNMGSRGMAMGMAEATVDSKGGDRGMEKKGGSGDGGLKDGRGARIGSIGHGGGFMKMMDTRGCCCGPTPWTKNCQCPPLNC
jgi:hypothetical protein